MTHPLTTNSAPPPSVRYVVSSNVFAGAEEDECASGIGMQAAEYSVGEDAEVAAAEEVSRLAALKAQLASLDQQQGREDGEIDDVDDDEEEEGEEEEE